MTLHPQSKRYIQIIQAQDRPPWQEIPIQESRELFASLESAFGVGPDLASVEDRKVGDIPIRIYRPEPVSADRKSPCVVYFHGGGWVIGNLDSHDTLCRHLANESQATVIAVDYRLAPEHKYPAAVDDCYEITRYVGLHAEEFGIDTDHLMLAGDSAGGNLAGAVSLRARDENGPKIRFQVLIYPVIEASFSTDSYHAFAEGYGLTADTMQWMWEQYWDETNPNDKKHVILTENDLKGLPKTHIITAEYDVLRDEGENFYNHLQQAGTQVTLKRYPGVLHGFIHFSALFDDGLVALQDIGELIRAETGSK